MPLQAKEIKSRLKSIKNTKKITRTMELVSAAKMRRAIESAMKTRPYASHMWNIVNRLKHSAATVDHEVLKRFFGAEELHAKKGHKIHTTLVLFTSNRGLCGGFNSQLVRRVVKYVKEHQDEQVEIIAVGKKGVSLL